MVAIAMLISSLSLGGLAQIVQVSSQQPLGGSCLVVGPQYYLTGRPRQSISSNRTWFVNFGRMGVDQENVPFPFGGPNAFSVEWHSGFRHRLPGARRLCSHVFANDHWPHTGDR